MSTVRINLKVITQAAIAAVKKFTGSFQSGLTRIGKSQETIRENFQQIRNIALVAAGAIAAAFGIAAKRAADFETGILGVAKTVNDLTEVELKALGEELREISRTTPFATKELLELAKIAGQLGVEGKDNIILFTTTIAKLGTAANISGEEAASALARILNITDESTENIDNLASAIVALGNSFAANESDIVEAARGIAQATSRFSVSSAEVVSFAAAFKSLGVQSELGRSVTLRAFGAISEAINKGGEDFERLEKITGLTGDTLKREFETNASRVFERFLIGVKKANDGGVEITDTLRKFGLSGIRVNSVLPVLVKRVDEVTRALDLGTKAAKENDALNKEYERQLDSTANTIKKLVNNLNDLAIEFGDIIAPVIKVAAEGLIELITFFRELSDVTKDIIVIGAAVTGVLAGITVVVSGLTAAFITLSIVAGILQIALIPFFLIPLALVAITTGIIVVIKNFDSLKNAVQSAAGALGSFLLSIGDDNIFPEFTNDIQKTTEGLDEFGNKIEEVGKKGEDNRVIWDSSTKTWIKFAESIDKAKLSFQSFDEALVELRGLRSFNRLAAAEEKAAKAREDAAERARKRAEANAQKLTDFKLANIDALTNAEVSAKAAELELEIIQTQDLSDERQKRLDDLTLKLGEEKAIKELARQEATEARKADLEAQLLEAQNDVELKAEINKELEELEKAENINSIKRRKETAERKRQIAVGELGVEKKIRKDNLDNAKDTLGNLTELTRSNSKELFAIGKAAATAQAIIDGIAGVQKALASSPPPFNFINAAVVGALAAANVSRIQSQQAPSFQEGGIVPGNSFSGDNVTANVNSGEMILNRQQQGRLFDMASGGEGGGKEIIVNNTVELDGEVVFNSVSRQVADGRELGEVV